AERNGVMVHKLLTYQLRSVAATEGPVDVDALTALVSRTYDEFDRERRLTDRASKLMEEELQEANAQVKRLAEQRLADTLESMPCPVAILPAAGHIQSANSELTSLCAGQAVSGESFAGLLGRLAPGEDAARALSDVLAGRAAELSVNGRWYLTATHRFSD